MKKKLLSLILVMMLIPFASIFAACEMRNGYNLDGLQKDFNKIVTENNNVKFVDGNIEFDYSNHQEIEDIINSTEPYTTLNDYNFVFNNLMAFSCSYIDECSNNGVTKNATIKNEVKENLDELSKSIGDVNECFNMFAEMINVSQSDPTANACLSRYEILIKTYESMYQSAINFTNSLSDLYYNHILKDGNPNIYSIDYEKFNASVVVTKLESRIKYQLSNLSQGYIKMYISGDFAKEITNGTLNFDLNKFDYATNIAVLNKQIDSVQVATEKANHNNNKLNFYNLAIQAQNIQETLNNDRDKFVEACNAVDFKIVKVDETATPYEKMCVDIIESNYSLILTYNNVLTQMLDIVA